ncbi:MAG: hypothetical protein AAGF90_01405 [Pseudomonadota bacterium]
MAGGAKDEGGAVGTAAIRELSPAVEVLLDRSVLRDLRSALGAHAFEEVFEDALFEVTERLARIERFVEQGALTQACHVARGLAALALQTGLTGAAEVADNLVRCCEAGDRVAAAAVARRLLRVGEDSLVKAAEMTLEDDGRLEGA